MSRPLRIQFPGAVYHIFTRGNAKQDIFRTDEDRYAFQKKLGEVVKVYDWICHTSCLMGNHYHLLVETLKGNLSLGMQSLNSDYAMGFHDRNGTDGHLFKGRFESRLIEKEAYLLEVMRYIVNNPVQAGLVEHPKDWKWSSYRAIAGIEDAPEFLMSDWVLGQFANDRKVAQALYQKFVEEGIGRESPYARVREGSILGSDQFIDAVREQYVDEELSHEIPKSERFVGRPSLKDLLPLDVQFDIPDRDNAIWFARKAAGYSIREIADELELDPSTVSRIVSRETEKVGVRKS